jgi:hypothetical protein
MQEQRDEEDRIETPLIWLCDPLFPNWRVRVDSRMNWALGMVPLIHLGQRHLR